MIYICIPAHNEEQTVGVVLWKIRQVMADFPRDYQLLVVDDASTDNTAEVLKPYARVLPLTVVRTEARQGEGAALEMMLREAVRRSEYPKRDVIVTLQADFTQEPGELISLIKRTEAGADIVVGEVAPDPEATRAVRWARSLARRVLGRRRIPEGVSDPFTSYRAYRVFAVKKALDERPGRLVHWSGWAGAAELLLATAPHARRVDTIPIRERRERLQRASRMLPWPALKAVWSLAREARPLVVASPAELDEAMRAVAAVRTSEVAARAERSAGGGRTQRGEPRRGTTEEQARRTRARREAREAAEGRVRTGSDRRERRPRQDRTEGTERPARAEGTVKRPRRERAPKARAAEPAPDTAEPLAVDPLLAAVGAAPEAGAEQAPRKRKRPRRRKKSAADGAGSTAEAADGNESNGGASAVTAALPAGSVEPGRESAAEDPGDDGGDAEDAPRTRRRRRGRRGGRRRNGNGGPPVTGEVEANSEAGDTPRVPESREPDAAPATTEGDRNDA